MVYYDIHTHHLPVHPEDIAIVNRLVPTLDAGSHLEQAMSRLNARTGLFCSVGIHPWYIYSVEEQLAELERQTEQARAELGKPFAQEKELEAKASRLAELKLRWTVSRKFSRRRHLLPKAPASS